jgi:hypothetical protein
VVGEEREAGEGEEEAASSKGWKEDWRRSGEVAGLRWAYFVDWLLLIFWMGHEPTVGVRPTSFSQKGRETIIKTDLISCFHMEYTSVAHSCCGIN